MTLESTIVVHGTDVGDLNSAVLSGYLTSVCVYVLRGIGFASEQSQESGQSFARANECPRVGGRDADA